MVRYTRYNLIRIIYEDLCVYGCIQLLLLLLILISAILVVFVTYQTRYIVMCYEECLLEKNALDTEWNNLVLQEKILSEHSRIESIARDMLHMHYMDITQDNF